MLWRPRITLRKVLWVIAFLGVAFWVGRYPFFALQADARFRARSEEAIALILSYDSVKPPEIDGASWQAAVHQVRTVWGEIVPARGYIADDELADILSQMRELVNRTNLFRAEGDLYSILDLLGHFHSQVPPSNKFLYSARSTLKEELQGKSVPSTGVISYARSMVGQKSDDMLADISAGLAQPDWHARVMACRALKELGLANRRDQAIGAVAHALEDDDALVREIALESLAAMGPESIETIPAIDDRLRRDPSSRVRVTAAAVLAELDPSGKVSVPLLVALLGDRDSALRLTLVRTLGDMGPQAVEASQDLIDVIEHDAVSWIRPFAVQSLCKVCPSSKTVPVLLEALRREQARNELSVAATILQTLGQIGPEAAPAIPVLIETCDTESNEHLRGSALIGLGGIGPSARAALPTILKAANATELFVKGNALEALTKITTEPDVVLPPLIAALKDKRPWIQKTAAIGLGKLGPAAKAAVPALKATGSLEATRAIGMIQGE